MKLCNFIQFIGFFITVRASNDFESGNFELKEKGEDYYDKLPVYDSYNSENFELEERRYKGIIKLTYSQITTDFTRREIHSRLQYYGCHCFPNGKRKVGAIGSKFVDSQDELCMKLALCHRCVKLEFDDVIDTNDSGYATFIDELTSEITCLDDPNSDNPLQRAKNALCQCDKEFAVNLGGIWSDNNFNQYYWLQPRQVDKYPNIERFDINDGSCKLVSDGESTGFIDSCCGDYPFKKPFSSAKKQCCDSGIVANLLEMCCDDGTASINCFM